MKHITDELSTLFNDTNFATNVNNIVKNRIVLDGEFYNHNLKDQFEELRFSYKP